MTKYRLTIIYDPDGMYGDKSYDFTASTDRTAKVYAKGLMTSKADNSDSIGHLKKYSTKTRRYHRVGVFQPAFMGGYNYVSEGRA